MKHFLSAVLLLAHWQLFAFKDVKSVFYFDSDIDTLNQQQHRELLDFITQSTVTKQYKEVYVVGFTDADGSNQYNIDLSKRRADFVSALLIKNGLPSNLIDKNFKGEEDPVAKNNSEKNKSKNRRVEVTMRLFDIQKVADVVKEINGNPEQVFTLDNTKENFIEGKNGMRFIFPPFCFDIKGNKKSDFQHIKIVLTEVTNATQGFFSNVLAECNNQLLQSGGMFKLTAFYDNTALKMKKDMRYTVQINNQNLQNDMNVFAPNTNQQDGLTRWENTAVAFEKTSSFKGVRPTLELDTNLIINWKLSAENKMKVNENDFKLPVKPIKPTVSKRPFLPYKPVITAKRYKVSWLKKLFLSGAKKKNQVNKYYDMDMLVYQKQMEKYNTKLAKYINDSATFEQRMSDYNIANKLFKDSIKSIVDKFEQYRVSEYEEQFLHSFKVVQPKIVQQLKNKSIAVHDFYNYVLMECNKRFYNTASTSNTTFLNFYIDFYKNLDALCQPDFTYRSNKFNYFTVTRCNDVMVLPVLFNKVFAKILKQDTAVLKAVVAAETRLQEEEVRLGLFNPANFRTYYQASLSDLDWINCDRFVKYKEDEIFTLQIPNYKLKDQNMFAIVKDINSQISIPLAENNMHRINLPKNKEIVVFAIGLDDNLNPQVAKYDLNAKGNVNLNLEFKAAKLSEIKEMIQRI
ncbi:MAG: OmpA family protein [Chitinophagales bacterium]